MVSADPRQSSLVQGFRTSSALPWNMPAGPASLPPQVFRGGPVTALALPGLGDETGAAITDEAGSALS